MLVSKYTWEGFVSLNTLSSLLGKAFLPPLFSESPTYPSEAAQTPSMDGTEFLVFPAGRLLAPSCAPRGPWACLDGHPGNDKLVCHPTQPLRDCE